MQTAPDVFTPPAFWGQYPAFGSGQTSVINTSVPKPATQTAPDYGDGQGLGIGQPIGNGMAGLQADKTVYPGTASSGAPAQMTWTVDASGALHSRDNVTNKVF